MDSVVFVKSVSENKQALESGECYVLLAEQHVHFKEKHGMRPKITLTSTAASDLLQSDGSRTIQARAKESFIRVGMGFWRLFF